MLSILLTSNFPLLETSLLVHNKKLLSPMLAYYFGFTNIRFLSTNIGILFCFCFSWIPPYQYWHIIFVLPTLHCSKPILVYYFLFTNVGFLSTIIGKLFSFYQHWFHLYQNWHIISFLPILISSLPILAYYLVFFFYQCWIPLYHYWYIFFVLPMLGYITFSQHWYVIYLFQRTQAASTNWTGAARLAQNRVRWRGVVDGLCSTWSHGPK